MAQPQLRAQFFATAEGVITLREKPLTVAQRKSIYTRDQGKCQKCHQPVQFGGNTVSPFDKIKSGHVDHIFAIARGGRNHPSNLQLLCMSCNSRKGTM